MHSGAGFSKPFAAPAVPVVATSPLAVAALAAIMGPRATCHDAHQRWQWFDRELQRLAVGGPPCAGFSQEDDEEEGGGGGGEGAPASRPNRVLLWVPPTTPEDVVAAIPHPIRGFSVALSWCHAAEGLQLASAVGKSLRTVDGLNAIRFDPEVVPCVLLPAMRILRERTLAVAPVAVVRKWCLRADEVRALIRDHLPAEHRAGVSLAVVAVAAWAVGRARPRAWPKDSKAFKDRGEVVVVPRKWRLDAECPNAWGVRFGSPPGWPSGILNAAYAVYVGSRRSDPWRVQFVNATGFVAGAVAYAADLMAAVRSMGRSEIGAWAPARTVAHALFGDTSGLPVCLGECDLAVMRQTMAASVNDFSWVVVAALVDAGVLTVSEVLADADALAVGWRAVLVPLGSCASVAGPAAPPGSEVPAGPRPKGLGALSDLLVLGCNPPRIVVEGAGPGGVSGGGGGPGSGSASTSRQFGLVFQVAARAPLSLTRQAHAARGFRELDRVVHMLHSFSSHHVEDRMHTSKAFSAAAALMDPAVVGPWELQDCEPRRELAAILAQELDPLLAGVASDPALFSARDDWCLSDAWLGHASSALWWWILAHRTSPGTPLRTCVAAAAELSCRWPALEQFLLWGAFVQVWRRQVAVPALPARPPEVAVWPGSVPRLEGVMPDTLQPVVAKVDLRLKTPRPGTDELEVDTKPFHALLARHASLNGASPRDEAIMAMVLRGDWTQEWAAQGFRALLAPVWRPATAGPEAHLWLPGGGGGGPAQAPAPAWCRVVPPCGRPEDPGLEPLVIAASSVVDAMATADTTVSQACLQFLHPVVLVETLVARFSGSVVAPAVPTAHGVMGAPGLSQP
jgi:hypothetical protein